MIPSKFMSASLADKSMLLAEADSAATAFFTRAQNPETFDAWSAHIRKNWVEKSGELFRYLRPETDSERETA